MSAICLISIVSVSILFGFFGAREIYSEIYKSEYLPAYNKLKDVNYKIELAEKNIHC